MRNMINRTHIEGYLYEADLQARESGPNSKKPGTKFITGTINIATDNEMTNIVPVHFTYITETTSSGKTDDRYDFLNKIINEEYHTVMKHGKDTATKVRVDSAIGLNDFYTERDGKEVLISAKRNEGGFIHTAPTLNEDEKMRNTFECDIVITNVKTIDADPERNLEEKAIVKGAIFDFRKSLLPVEFSVVNPNAISYFMGLEASNTQPVVTKIKGRQVSETVVRKVEEESAWGEVSVREVTSSRKDWVITWAQGEPYIWDDESCITAAELTEAMAQRETYLAGVKSRADEYKASKNSAPVAKGAFNF